MSIPLRPATPPSVLMLLSGSSSPLRVFAMTLWILVLAFGAMGTFALVGAWTSLRALGRTLAARMPRRVAPAGAARRG